MAVETGTDSVQDTEVQRLEEESANRLLEIATPFLEIVSQDRDCLKERGWKLRPRKRLKRSKLEWRTASFGTLAVGQKQTLRGPNGESLGLRLRYPDSANLDPDCIEVYGGWEEGNFSFTYDRKYKRFSAKVNYTLLGHFVDLDPKEKSFETRLSDIEWQVRENTGALLGVWQEPSLGQIYTKEESDSESRETVKRQEAS